MSDRHEYLPGHLQRELDLWHRKFSSPFCSVCGVFPGVKQTMIICEDCFTKRKLVCESKKKWFPSLEISEPAEILEQGPVVTNDVPKPKPDEPDDDESPDPNDEAVEDDETIL